MAMQGRVNVRVGKQVYRCLFLDIGADGLEVVLPPHASAVGDTIELALRVSDAWGFVCRARIDDVRLHDAGHRCSVTFTNMPREQRVELCRQLAALHHAQSFPVPPPLPTPELRRLHDRDDVAIDLELDDVSNVVVVALDDEATSHDDILVEEVDVPLESTAIVIEPIHEDDSVLPLFSLDDADDAALAMRPRPVPPRAPAFDPALDDTTFNQGAEDNDDTISLDEVGF